MFLIRPPLPTPPPPLKSSHYTYLLLTPIHPGINIISWCKKTAFYHPDKGYTFSPTLILSINLNFLTVYHFSSDSQRYTPSPEKFIYPFLKNDSAYPTIATVFSSTPPLWALCRIALGRPGVIPNGLGVEENEKKHIPSHFWAISNVHLGHSIHS